MWFQCFIKMIMIFNFCPQISKNHQGIFVVTAKISFEWFFDFNHSHIWRHILLASLSLSFGTKIRAFDCSSFVPSLFPTGNRFTGRFANTSTPCGPYLWVLEPEPMLSIVFRLLQHLSRKLCMLSQSKSKILLCTSKNITNLRMKLNSYKIRFLHNHFFYV